MLSFVSLLFEKLLEFASAEIRNDDIYFEEAERMTEGDDG